ncbi:MAG: hypothetical protein U0T02_10795 [Solirubrobacteraceae bacterium]
MSLRAAGAAAIVALLAGAAVTPPPAGATPGAERAARGDCRLPWRVVRLRGRVVVRDARGHRLRRPRRLPRGVSLRLARGGGLRIARRGVAVAVRQETHAAIGCLRPDGRTGRRGARLVPVLLSGTLEVRGGRRAQGAVVATPEAVARPAGRRAAYAIGRYARRTEARGAGRDLLLVSRRDPRALVRAHPGQAALARAGGWPTLDVFPFAPGPWQRRVRGRAPDFRAGGGPCATGCRPPGARGGWPIRPFHRPHPLRADINEVRPSGFHRGIDIQARDGVPVYALEKGRANVLASAGDDERVQVGRYVYWHVNLSVGEGAWVTPFRTVLGRTKRGFGHVHLSETGPGGYLDPLRPGGRVLAPWADTDPPVIGRPRLVGGGRVQVAVFDPQSTASRVYYPTPVLAPAALAWRLYDRRGRPLTPLRWAYRGTRVLPHGLEWDVFARGASRPGFLCFITARLCRPDWYFRLAGGLTPPLPRLARGRRYRLTVYAWDRAGNVTARDRPLIGR